MPAGQRDRTRQRLERALQLFSDGQRVRARGMVDEVLAREPDHLDALRLAAHLARHDDDLEGALRHLRQAVRVDPTNLAALDEVEQVADRLDRPKVAAEAAELAVIAAADDPKRQVRLASHYDGLGRLSEAEAHLRLALQLDPDARAARRRLGGLLMLMDRPVEAYDTTSQALGADSDDPTGLLILADAADALGRAEEATRCLQRAAELAPGDPGVALRTSGLRRYTADDPQIALLEAGLDDGRWGDRPRTLAGLALAKMWDDAGDTARAAEHLAAANHTWAQRLERRGQAYDPAGAERRRLRLAESIGPPPRIAVDDGPVPVLVTGLPRVGKSLLEARLARLPGMARSGEAVQWSTVVAAVERETGRRFPDGVAALEPQQRAALREVLHGELAEHAVGGEPPAAIVSTHPANAWYAGLAAHLDPRTVVVRCERDPRDTVLANLQQFFAVGNAHAWRIEDAVHAVHEHARLLDHWADVLPIPPVAVSYEQLVTEPHAALAAVVHAAGWRADALPGVEVADDTARVTTSPADKPDPDRPLHGAHVGLWRRWAPHLPGLEDAAPTASLVA